MEDMFLIKFALKSSELPIILSKMKT